MNQIFPFPINNSINNSDSLNNQKKTEILDNFLEILNRKKILSFSAKTPEGIRSEFKNNQAQLVSVTELSLTSCDLTNLPDEIGLFTQLKRLVLRRNDFTEFPSQIKLLPNLEELDLSRNKISMIPDDIFGHLQSLTYLDLTSNQLEILPFQIWQMTKLEYILVGSNKLINVSEEVKNLINLKALNVRDNLLKKLPDSLEQLSHVPGIELQVDARENPLISVPKNIKKGTYLKPEGCRLELDDPHPISQKDLEFDEYHRKMQQEEIERRWRENFGKTS